MSQIEIPTPLNDALTVKGKPRKNASDILKEFNVVQGQEPSTQQKEMITYCCSLIDSGIALKAAFKQTHEQYPAKPDEAPGGSSQENTVAIAKSETGALGASAPIPEAHQAGIKDVAAALAPETVDINKEMALAAHRVNGQIQQACQQEMFNQVLGPDSPHQPDPEKALEHFRKLREGQS